MAGTKRSTRLAARNSRPKYDELEIEEDDDNSSKQLEIADEGESDFSGGGVSDDASDPLPDTESLRPAETRAVTRRGRRVRQSKRPPEASKPSTKQSSKVKSKRQSKLSYDKKKTELSPSTNDDGSDHAVDDGCGQQEGILLKGSKRSRSTSDESMEGKKRKPSSGDNGKYPPPNGEIYESQDAPRNAAVDPGPHDTKSPLVPRQFEVGPSGTKKEGGVPDDNNKGGATQEDLELGTATNQTRGGTPIIGSNPQHIVESPPSLTSTSDWIEPGARSKSLTESDTTKCKEDMRRESIIPNTFALKGERELKTAGNDKAGASGKNNQGGNDQTCADSLTKTGSAGSERHNGKALLANAEDTLKSKRTTGTPSFKESDSIPSLPFEAKKKSLLSGGVKSASIKVASHDAIDAKEPDQNKSGQNKYPTGKNKYTRKDCVGSAVLGSGTSTENSSKDVREKYDAVKRSEGMNETTLHQPSNRISKEMERSSSVETQVLDSYVSKQLSTVSIASMKIQYPKPKRTRQAPSVDQLKMAIFLEASNAHRGNGSGRAFSNYWEVIEKYITVGSHGAIKRMRSDLSKSFVGTESTLRGFLKTRKMKRIHNKLVLAIMMEATKTDIPARCSSYIPQKWQTTSNKYIRNQLKKEDCSSIDVDCRDRKSDLLQWNADFGASSGAWTACGDELALTKTDSGHSIRPEIIGSIQKACHEEEEVLPSARLPGALEIEPLVRKHTADLGLTASENAMWMLVVAVREHSSSVMKKIIANDQHFDDGYAPSLPTHFQTGLACHHLTSKKDDQVSSVKNSGEGRKLGKKVINSTSLSHVLAESTSVASRLTSMRSSITSDDSRKSSHCPGLDNVNCIINASIQRGARKRQRSSPGYQNLFSTTTISHFKSVPPTRKNAGPISNSDGNSGKAQTAATQSISTTSLPLTKPHIAAQRTDHSTPLPLPPQSQLPFPSMPSQNMQPLNPAQLMSHSDHTKERKKFETLPISRADISNLEPLTKPGFPSLSNVSQKPEPSQNSVAKTSSPSRKALRRGSKNLAAMMSRPSSQPKTASDKGSIAGHDKNANGASLVKATAAKQKDNDEKQNEGAKEKKNDTEESKSSTVPSRPRGRGFGVKNLARMRAKTSD